MPLTDKSAQHAKPGSKTYRLADSEGMYLEVTPTGAKYWRLKYRVDGIDRHTGRPKRIEKRQPADFDALRRKAEAVSARRTEEAARRHAGQEVAARIWHAARPAGDEHPYLARKWIAAHGLRVVKGALVVPIRDAAGELYSLQFFGRLRRASQGLNRGRGFLGCLPKIPLRLPGEP